MNPTQLDPNWLLPLVSDQGSLEKIKFALTKVTKSWSHRMEKSFRRRAHARTPASLCERCPLEFARDARPDVLHPATIHAEIPIPRAGGRAEVDSLRLVVEQKFHVVDEP